MNSPDEAAIAKVAVPCSWCNDEVYPTKLDDETPDIPPPGSFVICTSCAMPMVWSASGNPRRPLSHEWSQLNRRDDVTELRKAIFMASAHVSRGVHFHDRGLM
jgi:hypothetical protein